MWAEAVGNAALAERLFQTALDLADAREGALFVVLRDPAARCRSSWRPPIGWTRRRGTPAATCRPAAQLLHLLRGRNAASSIRPCSPAWRDRRRDGHGSRRPAARRRRDSAALRAAGAALELVVEGARTTAAMAAGRFGPVLKVSEDGVITFYDQRSGSGTFRARGSGSSCQLRRSHDAG